MTMIMTMMMTMMMMARFDENSMRRESCKRMWQGKRRPPWIMMSLRRPARSQSDCAVDEGLQRDGRFSQY